jgi:hypothetical protein
MDEQDRFDLDEIREPEPAKRLARESDPETSKAAAKMNPGRRGSQRWRLGETFFLMHPDPLTWESVAKGARIDAASSPWRRLTELVERGIIEVVGETTTSRGARAQTYQLTQGGFDLFYEARR